MPTKRQKLAALKRASKEIADGSSEFSCIAMRSLETWYSRISAEYVGRERRGLSVQDFAGYMLPCEDGGQTAKKERLMWLAMLTTLVEDGEDKTIEIWLD